MSKNKKFFIGTAFAAAAGLVAGLLVAPKSGKETREDIRLGTKKAVKEAEKALHKAHNELTKQILKAEKIAKTASIKVKSEAKTVVDSATKSRDQAASVLAAVRSGNSNDEDLDLAVKNALNSLNNLKKFFKK